MHKKFLGVKSCIFGALFIGLVVAGTGYASWNSSIGAQVNLTSGTMDVEFSKSNEKYSAGIADANGNVETPVSAQFSPTDKELEISFDEGLPVNALLEGKLLRLDFQITPAQGSSVNRLNYTKLDLSKTGENVELQADSAAFIYNGVSYALGENESLYTQPLRFEVYETLSKEDKDESIGQIYLKLSDESANMIKDLPTKLDIDAANLEELGDDTLGVQNGVVVKYSLENPYDVYQAGSKVNKSVK
ncbi:MAG: hypothetical protein KH170_06295 [Lachnospiraceae bacterium oral taxon 082]|nr:hypothetical protein [Lachnospiraceae bacterium oral taxon 082]